MLLDYIEDKIDKEMVQSTNEFLAVRRSEKKERDTRKKCKTRQKVRSTKKQPCVVCEALNFPGRFHPIVLWRNGNRNAQRNSKEVNSLELFTSENEKTITLNENEKG